MTGFRINGHIWHGDERWNVQPEEPHADWDASFDKWWDKEVTPQ